MCFARGSAEDPFHHLCSHENAVVEDPRVLQFLKWAGDTLSAVPTVKIIYTSLDEIFRNFCLDETSSHRDLQSKRNKATSLLETIKDYIDACYRDDSSGTESSSAGRLFVDLPRSTPTKKGMKGKGQGRIAITATSKQPSSFAARREEHRKELDAKKSKQGNSLPNAARSLWTKMLGAASGTGFLVYSNEQPELDIPMQAKLAGRYADSGEVVSAFLIGQCIVSQAISFEAIRSASLADTMTESPNVIKERACLILLGNAASNRAVALLREQKEWKHFQQYHFGECEGQTMLYEGSPGSKLDGIKLYESTATSEFALISYFKSKSTKQIVLAFAGTTMGGTWGATRALCDPEWVEQFTRELRITNDAPLPSFEAVLLIKMENSKPVGFEIKKYSQKSV